MFPDSLHLRSVEYKGVAKPNFSKGFQGVNCPVLKPKKGLVNLRRKFIEAEFGCLRSGWY